MTGAGVGVGTPFLNNVGGGYDPSIQGFFHYFNLKESGADSKLHPNTDGSGTITNGGNVNFIDPWYVGVRPMAGYSTEAGGGPIWDATNKNFTFPAIYKLRTNDANAYGMFGADRTLCFYGGASPVNGILATVMGGEQNRGQLFFNGLSGFSVFNGNGSFVNISQDFSNPMFITLLNNGTTRVYTGSTVTLQNTVTTAGSLIGEQYIIMGNNESGFGTATMATYMFAAKLKTGGMTVLEMQALSDYWRSF
jgi:hypothetical protein